MDVVVIGLIGTVIATIVVYIGLPGYSIRKIMKHPPSYD